MTTPARRPAPGDTPRRHVLVEGASDAAAVTTLAARLGRDLTGVVVVPMGGITSLRRHLRAAAADGIATAGLYDAAEERVVRRTLADLGLDGTDPAAHHLFRCERDLEDELIRACTPDGVVAALTDHGDLARFRAFQHQPFQRGRPVEAQLRRFLGTTSGRKLTYATRLAAVVPLDRTPTPIRRLLDVVHEGTPPAAR